MARPKTPDVNPAWFKLDRYAGAISLSMRDWFLNLELRGEIRRANNPNLVARVTGTQPIIYADEEDYGDLMILRLNVTSPVFWHVFDGEPIHNVVGNMTPNQLYYFEERLPVDVREFGKQTERKGVAPEGYLQSLNDQLPKQFLNRFVRLNLAFTDAAILQEVQRYLDAERAKLATIKPDAPFAKSLTKVSRKYKPNPDAWTALKVLPLIDLRHWAATNGHRITEERFCDLLGGLSIDQLHDATKHAEFLLDQFSMHGWLIPRINAEG